MMSDYRPVFYYQQLSSRCICIKKTIRELGIDVEMRNVLLSRKNREELKKATGHCRVPCLVIAGTIVYGSEEIRQYLCLRYGHQAS